MHPDFRRRGIGRRLLDWQIGRGTEQHADLEPAAPARLVAHVFPHHGGAGGPGPRRAGSPRSATTRSCAAPSPTCPRRGPSTASSWSRSSADRDDEVRRAHNASFTEHHGSVERDEVAWRSWFTGQRAFRPDLSVLALSGGAVVGYVLAYVYEADTQATGVREARLGQIGVLPGARGRGIAARAIAAALRAAAAARLHARPLDVDTENTTGALRLYERLGFRTTARGPRGPWPSRRSAGDGWSAGSVGCRPWSASITSVRRRRSRPGGRAHRATEPLHNHLYFAPEQDEHLRPLGVRPGRMCYFAGRAAPMGAVGPGVVAATFYNFSPSLVARLIPRAWTLATPSRSSPPGSTPPGPPSPACSASRDRPGIEELAGLLREACAVLTPEGRPLYAGHADLPWPEEPLLQVWHGATLLREHRGDGHIAVLRAARAVRHRGAADPLGHRARLHRRPPRRPCAATPTRSGRPPRPAWPSAGW